MMLKATLLMYFEFYTTVEVDVMSGSFVLGGNESVGGIKILSKNEKENIPMNQGT